MPEWMRDFSAAWAHVFVAIIAIFVAYRAFVVSRPALDVAQQSVLTAKKTAQANLVILFLNEYATNKMMCALIWLAAFKKNNKQLLDKIAPIGTASKDHVELLKDDSENAISNNDVDEARRFVDQYFIRAYKLWKHEFFDDIAAKLVIENEAYRGLFFEVVTPLTLAVGLVRTSNKDPDKFIEIQKKNAWRDELRHFCPPKEAT